MARTAGVVGSLLLVAGLAVACSPADASPSGTRTQAYVMDAGDTVYVDPAVPLPEKVLKDIAFSSQLVVYAIPPLAAAPGEKDLSASAVLEIAQLGARAEAETGRQLSIVYRTWGVPDVGGEPQWLWSATRSSSQTATPDKDAKVAEVTDYVAQSDDPSAWDVIVLT